jgi:integrase
VIEWNPAAHAKPPKASTANEQARRKRRFLDIDEVRRFLDACAGHRLEAGFQLSAMTGMRRGEVLGLRWRDIDMDAARLVVEQTLVSPRCVMSFSEAKTSQGRRSIDLDPLTVQKLKSHKARQAAERLAFGDGYQDSGLVFRQPDGLPVQPALFTLAFKQLAKKAKLGPLRLHDLRHTQVALLASAGVPAKLVSKRLGHHSAGFTLDSYGGTSPAQHQEAAAKLAVMVEGWPSGGRTLAQATAEASEARNRSRNRAAADDEHHQPIETAERRFTTECVAVPEERTPHCADSTEPGPGTVEVNDQHTAGSEKHYAEDEKCDA